MNLLTVPTPAGLPDIRERPAQSPYPDIPLWVENYCSVCYDPASEIGLWTHLGRAPFDPTLWRELTMLYLPNGDRIVHKGYGRSETDRGPGGATFSHQLVEPWNHWHSHRDGGSVRMTAKQLDGSMATDRAHERMAFELDWRAVSPVWDWGQVEEAHGWGRLHYEQLCQVQGTFIIGGEEVAFDGLGLRDHTAGPRDFTVFTSHIWSWAVFPSGRGFITLLLYVDGQRLERSVVLQDGELTTVTLRNDPLITSRDEGDDPYELHFDDHVITAKLQHQFPNGFAGPNDICLGYDPAVVETANFEAFTEFTWGDELGHGLTQRSVKER